MKTSILIVLLSFLTIQLCLAQAGNSRQRLSMDLDWRFSQSDTVNANKAEFNDNKWRVLNLPHDWSIESEFVENAPTTGRGGYLPTGIGWYRKHFFLPKSSLSKSIWIEFDAVYQNSDVWINGHHLGHYPSGYISFYYDLTSIPLSVQEREQGGEDVVLKAGENVITVRVDNSRQPNSRWYSGSGIYRHVWLTMANPLHVAQWGTYITTPVSDSSSATVSVKTTLENKNTLSKTAVLRSTIIDPRGIEVVKMETPFTSSPEKNSELEQQLKVSFPLRWEIETPNMYSLRTQIIEKGKVIDEVLSPFGIRDIRYDVKKGFLLNGKHVKMNGVCLHHDGGSVGAAVPEAVWVRRLNVLKTMGCNAIRTSHNPMAPEFLDLCDRMGFLVQDESFDEWTSGKVKYGYSNYFRQWSQHDLVNFIHRDRNHPSVVMWSAGNEIGEQKREDGLEILMPLLETFHREDNTRPVTTGNDNIAADGGAARLPFLEALDIVGYNYVDRWHQRRELFYDLDHHDHPNWKMMGTESVSIPGVRGNYYGGVFVQVDSDDVHPANISAVIRAEQLWKFVSSHDYIIGDFMWTGIDYLGEARWPNKNASSGVIDLCGFPKDAYYFYQSQWTQKPMIHLAPHWNWKGKEGKIIPVMVYTNCDTVELFLNGKSFGMKSLEFPRQGNSGGWNLYDRPQVSISTADLHLMWDVPYEPGTLKAVGRKNGKIVCEEDVKTSGIPASVRLSVDRQSITADGRDVAHLKIEMVDADGLPVPNANSEVLVTVEGAGSLIGLDNGNPADHTSMKSNSRRVFNGLALAIIQSQRKPGTIRVKVSSPGLKESSVEVLTGKKDEIVYVESLKK